MIEISNNSIQQYHYGTTYDIDESKENLYVNRASVQTQSNRENQSLTRLSRQKITLTEVRGDHVRNRQRGLRLRNVGMEEVDAFPDIVMSKTFDEDESPGVSFSFEE
mmetsp:Transcript_24483/g.30114  ORF Transcript_24483/g.30114 Transcript_24483/m.30114 type:complete len:107 (+) Transcript_24483:74-394(+)